MIIVLVFMYSCGVCKTVEHVLILSGNFSRCSVATQYNCQHDNPLRATETLTIAFVLYVLTPRCPTFHMFSAGAGVFFPEPEFFLPELEPEPEVKNPEFAPHYSKPVYNKFTQST